jgi:hypothetical protein
MAWPNIPYLIKGQCTFPSPLIFSEVDKTKDEHNANRRLKLCISGPTSWKNRLDCNEMKEIVKVYATRDPYIAKQMLLMSI